MPDHVQRYGERRSAIRHASPDEGGQGPFLSSPASGVSPVEAEIANSVDEFVFLRDQWGAPLSLIKQYLEHHKHVSEVTETAEKSSREPETTNNVSFSHLSDACRTGSSLDIPTLDLAHGMIP